MFKNKITWGCIIALFFICVSCSDDENSLTGRTEEQSIVTIEIVQQSNITDDEQKRPLKDPLASASGPYFLDLVLKGSSDIGSMDDPLRIKMDDLNGSHPFTTLEMNVGSYSIEHFIIRNGGMEPILIAPYMDAVLSKLVDNPLPLHFDLKKGVNKKLNVEVVALDDRSLNEFGYQFFNYENTRNQEFCIFGSVCDESGRQFLAEYSVDVWRYSEGSKEEKLYTNLKNEVVLNEYGDYASSPLCIALPDKEGITDNYYFEITLEDSELYGDIENKVIRKGVISDDQVRSLFEGENKMEYYHFRLECNMDNSVSFFQKL